MNKSLDELTLLDEVRRTRSSLSTLSQCSDDVVRTHAVYWNSRLQSLEQFLSNAHVDWKQAPYYNAAIEVEFDLPPALGGEEGQRIRHLIGTYWNLKKVYTGRYW